MHSLEWDEGIWQHYPLHVQSVKYFAWKPLVINKTAFPMMFLVDVGATFTFPLTPLDILQQQGIFLVQGHDADMKQHSHPQMYTWFYQDNQSITHGLLCP